MTGQLGQGCSRLLVYPRGGEGPALADLGTPQMTWARRLTQTTQLSASIVDFEDQPLLSVLEPWTHEAQVWRDGELTWVGPVWDPDYEETDVGFAARDLSQWFARRWLPKDRDLNMDLGTIFATYARDALAADPSPNITIDPQEIGVRGERKVLASEHRYAADALGELARSGVDWTAIGRHILCGGKEIPLASLPPLLDHMVLKPKFTPRGSEAASEVATIGGRSKDGTQIVGHAYRDRPRTGLLQRTNNESQILDKPSADANAESALAGREAPATLTAVLTEQAPAMSQLIPGARWPVNIVIGCREVVGTMRLQQVTVNQSVSDAGLTETVAVTLISLGAEDNFS